VLIVKASNVNGVMHYKQRHSLSSVCKIAALFDSTFIVILYSLTPFQLVIISTNQQQGPNPLLTAQNTLQQDKSPKVCTVHLFTFEIEFFFKFGISDRVLATIWKPLVQHPD
jgi:hypothetical protein